MPSDITADAIDESPDDLPAATADGRRVPLAADDLVAGLAATLALLCLLVVLGTAVYTHGGPRDPARAWIFGLSFIAGPAAGLALMRVGRSRLSDGSHRRRVAEPAMLALLLLAIASLRGLPLWPAAVLPGAARMAAASLASMVAWTLVGAATTRVLPGAHRILLTVLAVAMFIVTVASAADPLAHGFDAVRADGWLRYTNATAGAASVTLLLGLRGLAADRARREWPLRLASGIVLALATVVLASTASRAMTVAAVIGVCWLVGLGRRGPSRVAGFVSIGAVTALLIVALLAASISGSFVVPLLLAVLAIAVAMFVPEIAGRVAERRTERGPWSTGQSRSAFAILTAIVIVVLIVPAQDAWKSFTEDASISTHAGVSRLTSASGNHRWQWWQEAAHSFSHHLAVGRGGDAFLVLHRQVRADASIAEHVHNLPLELLLEGGLVFGGAALIGLALLVLATWRAAQPRAGGAGAALGAISITLLVGSLADWTLDGPLLLVAFASAAGAAVAVGAATHDQRDRVTRPIRLRGSIALGIAVVAVVVASAPILAASIADWRASSARDNGDRRTAATWAHRSFQLVPTTDRMVAMVADTNAAHGATAAEARATKAALGPLRNDEGAWEAVYAISPVWGASALQLKSRVEMHRLDPLEHPPV